MNAVRLRTLVALAASLLAESAVAERVQVPLSLDAEVVEALVRERLFGSGALRVNDDGTGCQYLELRDPQVSVAGSRLLVRVQAAARAGRAIGGQCRLVLDWRGGVELAQRPELAADGGSILLHTDSWRALRPDGSTDDVSTVVGRWLEQFLPSDLTRLRIDLTEPLAELRGFLGQVAVPGGDGAVDAASLAIDAVGVGGQGVDVTLGVDAQALDRRPAAAEPVLSAAELAALEQRLDAVDAFFSYTIRSLVPAPPEAQTLFEVLVDLRREVVAILAEPALRGEDPARRLFVAAWRGLAPVLRRLGGGQGDPAQGLHYLTFIGAGDALEALDALGPALGIEISSAGLRRLARLLVPEDGGDPLQRSDAVDAELRRALGFGEPLPPPQRYDDASRIDLWLELLVPRAVAAEDLDPALVKKLNNWVPRTRDMDVYLPMAGQVLHYAATAELRDSTLDGRYRDLFRYLVLAAAWQESCWRQFEAKKDMRVPVESGSGDLGLMQINPRVWRGLYDLHGLRWDIVYNARAGADILEHYLVDYALRHREHETTGSVDNLARATYAAYNGGPRQYARYRRAAAPADELFWEKYRQVQKQDLAVTACYSGG